MDICVHMRIKQVDVFVSELLISIFSLIRWVCATSVLNLPPCFEVEKTQKVYPGLEPINYAKWYCIALYCIVLEIKIIFMLYLFNQMILPFPFSSTKFLQKSFKFSFTAIGLSHDICSAFQN